MSIEEEWGKAEKEIFEKVFQVINELSEIESQYCSWDEFEKSDIVSKARIILLEGFKKEIQEKL